MITIGWTEILLILVILIILLSPWQIPKLAKALGEARKEYKRGLLGETKPESVIIELAEKLGIETSRKTAEQIVKEIEERLKKRLKS